MGEGVDPTQMCQTLVDKVARSRQLLAVAEPEILVLFENWLEELEEEAEAHLNRYPTADSAGLAKQLGISMSGADFLLAKIRQKNTPAGAA